MMQLAPRLGINPIGWTNDDFHDLGGDLPLEACLDQVRDAGYAGCELGRKFPRQPAALEALLAPRGLALVSGWHSTYVLERDFDDEARDLDAHLDLLAALGCRVAIVAECSGRTYSDGTARMRFGAAAPRLGAGAFERLAAGLERLAERAARRDLRLAYHHHTGTCIQERDAIDQLMRRTQALGLLVDTGHLALARVAALDVLADHGDRVAHVHLKNVRSAVVDAAHAEAWSFEVAVRRGVFTVPGDGGIDYAPILAALEARGYDGWLVVEAEQDPAVTPALPAARAARAALLQLAAGGRR
jgi:myo-inosose-2 dehydratase